MYWQPKKSKQILNTLPTIMLEPYNVLVQMNHMHGMPLVYEIKFTKK
jgi:hypothetical protein